MMGWVVSGHATSQAELAPTRGVLIDRCDVEAISGYEKTYKPIRNCSRDL